MNDFYIEVFMVQSWCKEHLCDENISVFQRGIEIYPNKDGFTIIIEFDNKEKSEDVYKHIFQHPEYIDTLLITIRTHYFEIYPYLEKKKNITFELVGSKIVINFRI